MLNDYLESYTMLENELNKLILPKKFSKENNMRLERITHLLEILGNPQHAFKSIHVGGTSGKGSTSVMISSILSTAGYKTGLHLSPHLQLLNERFQINNQMVSTTTLSCLYNQIKAAIQEVTNSNPFGQPSYFEVQTAMAFCLFKREQVDVAIVEVGLGGELDATNVLQSDVAVLTSVGLDHTEILGDTVEKIAVDKSGIIKGQQFVISGVTQDTVKQIVKNKALKEKATLWQLGNDFKLNIPTNKKFEIVCPERVFRDLSLSLFGDFQIHNAACAVAAVNAFAKNIPSTAVEEGLKKAFIPGRLEVVQHRPLVILDGAHNPDKMSASVEALRDNFTSKRKIIVLSIKDGKDYTDILSVLLGLEEHFIVVLTAFSDKGLWNPVSPDLLAAHISERFPSVMLKTVYDPLDAVKYAISLADYNDLVFVTGSLYMIGDVRGLWYPLEDLLKQAEENIL